MRKLPDVRIVLGSSSKFRQQVLLEMGHTFEVISPDIDEKTIRLNDPVALTLAIAQAKLSALVQRIEGPAIIITADQVVSHAGAIREKPITTAEAKHFLQTSSKASSQTVSSVVVFNTETGRQSSGTDIVTITLRDLSESTIDALITEGTIMHIAGALQIENPLFKPFVKSIDGTLDSIVGLPKELTQRLIDEVA